MFRRNSKTSKDISQGASQSASRRTSQDWHRVYNRLRKTHNPQTEFAPYEDIDNEEWHDIIHGRGSSGFRKRKYGPKNAPFCGPAGGAMLDTYPVDTPAQARASLAYARHAPDELGVRECIHRVESMNDWTHERMPQSRYSAPPEVRRRRESHRGMRGRMSSTARTHERAHYPGVGGKYSNYFNDF